MAYRKAKLRANNVDEDKFAYRMWTLVRHTSELLREMQSRTASLMPSISKAASTILALLIQSRKRITVRKRARKSRAKRREKTRGAKRRTFLSDRREAD